MAIAPAIVKGEGQKPISMVKRRRTREQKGQAARRASMRLSHQHFGERQQILTSQAVQRQRAIEALRADRQNQQVRSQRSSVFRRTVVNSATSGQPIGQQQGQGVGALGIILRIFIALVVFSMLYLVLTNANQTSGIIKTFGSGLVGLSSDKTLFVKRTA
jgi:hypothetical protein